MSLKIKFYESFVKDFSWIFVILMILISSGAGRVLTNEPGVLNLTSSFLTLRLHTNFSILCEDNEDIEWWSYKTVPQLALRTKEYILKDDDLPYKNILILSNLSFAHTNLYFCISRTAVEHMRARYDYDKKLEPFRKEQFPTFDMKKYQIIDKSVSKVYVYVKAYSDKEAPVIFPTNASILLEKNTNFNISCEADESIFWWSDLNFGLASIKYTPSNPKRPFGEKLLLINVTRETVASSYCIKKEQIDEKYENSMSHQKLRRWVRESIAASIHVYVKDDINLLAPMNQTALKVLLNRDIVIACRPTEPQNLVKLVALNGEELCTSENLTACESEASNIIFDSIDYDPTIGFSIRRIRKFNNEILCQSKNNQSILLVEANNNNQLAFITSNLNRFATIGETFQLTCQLKEANYIILPVWTLPSDIEKSRVNITLSRIDDYYYHGIIISTLTIFNAQKSDAGFYYCTTVDYDQQEHIDEYEMKIYDINETYFYLSKTNYTEKLETEANQTMYIAVNYHIHPEPSLTWITPDNNSQWNLKKFQIQINHTSIVIQILNTQLEDSGLYTLNAKSGGNYKKLEFNVRVSDIPIIKINDVYIRTNETANVSCHVISYPEAYEIFWEFIPCDLKLEPMSCYQSKKESYKSTSVRMGNVLNEMIYELLLRPKFFGKIKCTARNERGFSNAESKIFITDFSENITVLRHKTEEKIVVGDEIEVVCTVSAYHFTHKIFWFKNGKVLDQSPNVEFINSESKFSHIAILKLKKIQHFNAGDYECRATYISEQFGKNYGSGYIHLNVYDPIKPKITQTNLNSQNLKIDFGASLKLICKAEGLPQPKIDWYKNDFQLKKENNTKFLENNTIIQLSSITSEDEGTYKCVASNDFGQVEGSTMLEVINFQHFNLKWIVSAAFVCLLLLAILIFLVIRYKQERRQLKELNEQANLLPNDQKYEFPREKLVLGKQLGSGAFGVVLKAQAFGIQPDEDETTVAVKMVNKTADNEIILSLVSELKIMIYLGQHVNIVNLLGAVTKDISIRDLMVIVEFCPHGNVQDFLVKNRKYFINQINQRTNEIDATLLCNASETCDKNSYELENLAQSQGTARADYIKTEDFYNLSSNKNFNPYIESPTINQVPIKTINTTQANAEASCNKNFTNCKTPNISTTVLIDWGIQVACGMDFLVSKQVLHGDLAARNILLFDNNLVKICDFGQSRKMYNRQYHRRLPGACLPFKWLALESLTDALFTKYSDVWSFGIVLWEFFSLGQMPYPGMEIDAEFLRKLLSGYRMEKPPYANDALYKIMLKCWSTNPKSRPLFNQLEKELKRLSGKNVSNFYLEKLFVMENIQNQNETQKHSSNAYLPQHTIIEQQSNAYLMLNTNSPITLDSQKKNLNANQTSSAAYMDMTDVKSASNFPNDNFCLNFPQDVCHKNVYFQAYAINEKEKNELPFNDENNFEEASTNTNIKRSEANYIPNDLNTFVIEKSTLEPKHNNAPALLISGNRFSNHNENKLEATSYNDDSSITKQKTIIKMETSKPELNYMPNDFYAFTEDISTFKPASLFPPGNQLSHQYKHQCEIFEISRKGQLEVTSVISDKKRPVPNYLPNV